MFSEGVALDRDLRVDGADQRRMTARAIAFVAAMRKHLFDGAPWPAPRPDEAAAVVLAARAAL
jgi:hypothetical protein